MSEELIVKHCSPTLAGMKTGNLFTCVYKTETEVRNAVRRLNRLLVPKGLRVLPMRYSRQRALIYIYRPEKLKSDLEDCRACTLLRERGYICGNPEHCIVQLVSRLRTCVDFPHEIGLFLGYPPEDVQGFIENKADHCKCMGYWKVYGDERQAKKLFEKYRECTEIYHAQWSKGKTIEQLTVAV